MSTVEVCEICDIADCRHIRARRSGTALDRHVPFQSSLLVRDWTPAQGISTPWLRLREAFGEADTILSSHPMAAPLKPRTSTLRVKTIRWSGLRPKGAVFAAREMIEAAGGVTRETWQPCQRPDEPFEYVFDVTWPESE